jgi:hypothetical protein
MVFVEISPEKLPPGTHTAAVTISAWQATNQAVIPVRVTVLPAGGLTVPQK